LSANGGKPSFAEERLLESLGYRLIAGIDEAGRGALVGPVVAAAVILPARLRKRWVSRVKDSKLLGPAAREHLDGCIREVAVAVGVGIIDNGVIDSRGIAAATRLAMKAAVEQLSPRPEFLLVDYFKLPEVSLPQKNIKFGDRLCYSIASASIIAKVARDRIMVEMDGEYPGYGMAAHKGYGTRGHIENLRRKGPCPLHRRSFRPVREALAGSLSPR
jgi:ribonuclease HII